MDLNEQIAKKRAEIKTDGYPMSIGELANLYTNKELDLHPEFQRFYRWSMVQKSRLIESILLGIPLPSIFLSQRQDGVWDVIDGLQRLSTIFEFMGLLRDENGKPLSPLVLSGTKYLPALEGKRWGAEDATSHDIGVDNQRIIKRSKVDLKIILRESDPASKYELFQRLNTGGSPLEDQELRNCIMIMTNRGLYSWILKLAQIPAFRACISLGDRALEEQFDLELIVRYLVFRKMPIEQLPKVDDLSEYLTDQILQLENRPGFDRVAEEDAFTFVFNTLTDPLGDDSFRRYDSAKKRYLGGFLISAFEAVAMGLGYHAEVYAGNPPDVAALVKKLWTSKAFSEGIGAGVRATTRLQRTLNAGRKLFQP